MKVEAVLPRKSPCLKTCPLPPPPQLCDHRCQVLFSQHKCNSVSPLLIETLIPPEQSPVIHKSRQGLISACVSNHAPTRPSCSLDWPQGAQNPSKAPSCHFSLACSLHLFQTTPYPSHLIQGILLKRVLQCCSTFQVPKAKIPGSLRSNPSSATYFGQLNESKLISSWAT